MVLQITPTQLQAMALVEGLDGTTSCRCTKAKRMTKPPNGTPKAGTPTSQMCTLLP